MSNAIASTISSSVTLRASLRINAPTITLTGVLGLDAFLLYRTEKMFSSIAGKTLSAKVFVHDFSNIRFSRSVRLKVLSKREIC